MKKTKIKTDTIVLIYSVIAILLTSGGGYLNSIILLLLAAFMMLLRFRVISYKSLLRGVIIIAYISLNSLIINRARFDSHEYLINILRILCLVIIIDKISVCEFKSTLVKIVEGLSIFSLFWYVLLLVFPNAHIPFEMSGSYVGSFYHIIGFSRSNHIRNAGVFWEPGVFQIYINFALAFVSIEPEKYRNPLRKFIVLSLTLLSTTSTGGYLIYGMILAFMFFRRKSGKTMQRLKGLLIPLFLALAAIEAETSIIGSKLLNRGLSYASRHDDLLIGISMFLNNPIIGTGICAENTSIRNALSISGLVFHDKTKLANSNGLVNVLSRGGLVFTIPYIFMMYRTYLKWFQNNKVNAIEMFLVSLLALINEPLGFTPFWMIFFFELCDENKLSKNSGEVQI